MTTSRFGLQTILVEPADRSGKLLLVAVIDATSHEALSTTFLGPEVSLLRALLQDVERKHPELTAPEATTDSIRETQVFGGTSPADPKLN